MVQLEPAAKVPVHEVVLANGEVVTMLVIARLRVPVLVKVTVCAALVVPTVTLPNESVVLERFTAGAPVLYLPCPPPFTCPLVRWATADRGKIQSNASAEMS